MYQPPLDLPPISLSTFVYVEIFFFFPNLNTCCLSDGISTLVVYYTTLVCCLLQLCCSLENVQQILSISSAGWFLVVYQ